MGRFLGLALTVLLWATTPWIIRAGTEPSLIVATAHGLPIVVAAAWHWHRRPGRGAWALFLAAVLAVGSASAMVFLVLPALLLLAPGGAREDCSPWKRVGGVALPFGLVALLWWGVAPPTSFALAAEISSAPSSFASIGALLQHWSRDLGVFGSALGILGGLSLVVAWGRGQRSRAPYGGKLLALS